jgi:RNA polymerase sigma factor (sigma-70 family)
MLMHPNPAPKRDDPAVTGLVTRARNGDKHAWDALVERYAPLIWSICRRYHLGADAGDVGQRVWLQFVGHLDALQDPAALPGWLAATTRHECVRALRAARGPHAARYALDTETISGDQAQTAEQQVLAAERHAALLEAFARLPPCCQQLILLLIQDPPVPYAQISARLGIPVGSIGPNRGRCLDRLRHDPAIAALINTEAESAGSGRPGPSSTTAQYRYPAIWAGCAAARRSACITAALNDLCEIEVPDEGSMR